MCRQIQAIPVIKDQDVPRFLENPLAFIPEEIEFDADLFSKRVKGLKIRTASAVPYIHIEKDINQTGWFELDTGLTLHDHAGEREDVTVDARLHALISEAAQKGQQRYKSCSCCAVIHGSSQRIFNRLRQQY